MLNLCVFEGRLTKDPERKTTNGGIAIAEVTIAVDNSRRGIKNSLFLDVAFYAQTAENVLKFFKKGSTIIVQGSLDCRTITDRQTGAKRNFYALRAQAFDFPIVNQRIVEPETPPVQDPLTSSAIMDDDMPF